MPKSLPSAKEASWRRIVDEYASSGGSAKEFCLLKAISLRMFYSRRLLWCLLRPLGSRDGHRCGQRSRRYRCLSPAVVRCCDYKCPVPTIRSHRTHQRYYLRHRARELFAATKRGRILITRCRATVAFMPTTVFAFVCRIGCATQTQRLSRDGVK
jgi:hypothetical protein